MMFKSSAPVSIAVLVLSLAGAPTPAQEAESEDTGIWSQVVALYEQAKQAGETAAEDVYEWAREDLEAIGDWEYKVEYFSNPNHIALEKKTQRTRFGTLGGGLDRPPGPKSDRHDETALAHVAQQVAVGAVDQGCGARRRWRRLNVMR